MLDNTKAVIFDVDGTLVDSMWIWRQVDIEFLGKRGIELPENLQAGIEGLSYTETAIYFKERFDLPDSIEDIKDEWRVMAEDFYRNRVRMKKGASELIRLLHNRGLKLGIATSNSKELVEYMLDRHHIREFFHSVRTSCEVPKGKPHPDVYLKVAEDLDVSPSECLVFEDTLAGATAGISAGMRVIAVEDEYSLYSRDKLIEITEMYIKDYYDIIDLIKKP
ncbi:MAG: HAD family hydrolase [Bacillota bacterium]